MRIVLIHPPLINIVSGATPEYVDKNRGNTPPLGLLYIQAAVENSGHESFFLDAALMGWDYVETAQQALSYNPDLIGLQAMTFTLRDAYMVVKAIKSINCQIKVLIGGAHPTIYPEETAQLDGVDFAFAGEGEVNFINFLNVFNDQERRRTVPGIACKVSGKVVYTPTMGTFEDLDCVSYPSRKSSLYRQYTSVLSKHNLMTTMITSRGCPFYCVFCNRMGRTYRYHSAKYVLGEIEQILGLGIQEIFIHDDTFTLNRDRVEHICRGIIERQYKIVWEARTRVDCVDQRLLALMRKAGCYRLSFGVESGSERVLKSMKKEIKLEMVEKVFKWCRSEGIVTLADFMFGNLDETAEDIKKTLEFIKRIDPNFAQYSICTPYPDTPLYQLGLKKGFIPRDVWKEFACNPLQDFRTPVWNQYFKEEELKEITASAYKAFYLRPNFILKQLMRINSFDQFKKMAYGAIGMLRK